MDSGKMRIGVIGYGYVGSAVAHSYSAHEVWIYDPALPDISDSVDHMKFTCDVIFVCVPTPSDASGRCDVTVLSDTLNKLVNYTGLVICKSTAPPDVYQHYQDTMSINLVHVPEFLTQARAKQDYLNPHKILVGCKPELRHWVTEVIRASDINFDYGHMEYCGIAEASFFKYLANTMLAMKVTVCNEFYDLAQQLDIDWNQITRVAQTDPRLGHTHWSVPGLDGQRGYGGACFPKDTQAVEYMARSHNVDTTVLTAMIASNQRRRT